MTFLAADETTNQLVGEFVKAQAKDVLGIDIEVQIVDGAAYQEAFNASDFQLTYTIVVGGLSVSGQLAARPVRHGQSTNILGYYSAQVDDLVERAAARSYGAAPGAVRGLPARCRGR